MKCTKCPVPLGKDHFAYVEGDPTEYVVQYFQVRNAEDNHTFCVIKSPFCAMFHKDTSYSVSWMVYDDFARQFIPLSLDQRTKQELQIAYYAGSASWSSAACCFLWKYSQLTQKPYALRCTQCSEGDKYTDIAAEFVVLPSRQGRSVVRVIGELRRVRMDISPLKILTFEGACHRKVVGVHSNRGIFSNTAKVFRMQHEADEEKKQAPGGCGRLSRQTQMFASDSDLPTGRGSRRLQLVGTGMLNIEAHPYDHELVSMRLQTFTELIDWNLDPHSMKPRKKKGEHACYLKGMNALTQRSEILLIQIKNKDIIDSLLSSRSATTTRWRRPTATTKSSTPT